MASIDGWIQRKIEAAGFSGINGKSPRRKQGVEIPTNGSRDLRNADQGGLLRYQMRKFQETLDFAAANSPFYGRKLTEFAGRAIRTPGDIHALPFTDANELRKFPLQFVCVSQSEIARAVTLKTSGTTACPKRIFFTEADLELTVDYFAHAMADFVSPGQTVVIFMPGTRPDSIGQLLCTGLARIGVRGIAAGPVTDPGKARDLILEHEADCLIGIPIQILQLARDPELPPLPQNRIKSVILSSDYVPSPVKAAVESAWGCRVFNHYGMTEMGYAGGVECHGGYGYHFREADLYLEIIDPASGTPVPDGEPGEVVFTTLTRKGMPLIRYRTGDRARFLTEPCVCGSSLRRMEPVRGRLKNGVRLKHGGVLNLSELDEALFAVPGLMNYTAEISKENGIDRLTFSLLTASKERRAATVRAERAVSGIPAIKKAVADGALKMEAFTTGCNPLVSTGMIKRTLTDRRYTG